jgi:hypothetical protein
VVLENLNGGPGRWNDQPSPPLVTKNPRLAYCGQSSTVAPSLTGAAGMRNAWLSSTISETVWLASSGSALAKNSARSGPPIMMAI